jgi:hypothetical protein
VTTKLQLINIIIIIIAKTKQFYFSLSEFFLLPSGQAVVAVSVDEVELVARTVHCRQ